MTKKRLKELVSAFNREWPRGVHSRDKYSWMTGFNKADIYYGAVLASSDHSYRYKDVFKAFDPVTLQEMLVDLCKLKGVKGPNIE